MAPIPKSVLKGYFRMAPFPKMAPILVCHFYNGIFCRRELSCYGCPGTQSTRKFTTLKQQHNNKRDDDNRMRGQFSTDVLNI